MPTLEEHEAVLREKCFNGILYRNDAKLAAWLAIPVDCVESAIAELVGAGVLRRMGTSKSGAERYQLGLPLHLSDDARRLYQVMVDHSTASDVVNVATVRELAELASMSVDRTKQAFKALEHARLVGEETLGEHRFPVLLRRLR